VIELIRAASNLQTLCEKEGWRFCFIGGLAVQRWGEPRETVDVDLTLLTGLSANLSAEDLIVLKAFASRPRDWIHVEGIIVRQTGKLDWHTSSGNFARSPSSRKLRRF
jgi:hypothetical protein